MTTGSVLNLNGPPISSVTVKGPLAFLGSRHESEQVLPHPYSMRNVRSYEPSALAMRILGAGGLEPLRVNVRLSPRGVLRR